MTQDQAYTLKPGEVIWRYLPRKGVTLQAVTVVEQPRLDSSSGLFEAGRKRFRWTAALVARQCELTPAAALREEARRLRGRADELDRAADRLEKPTDKGTT